ncbi:MAG: hypothetical protein CVU03_12850 [Bacteroidetes bacterium HGW-Bacteroidetes-2]|jgi:hypothetical protein|nr:MAG: hypothetical protein CVU03_12850 [Bacteroidetes bacterium HGW-Bacteroidetes-2]
MSSLNSTKINRLLQEVPAGVVMTSAWLNKQGYNSDLIRSYRKSHWLATFGNGAVKRYNDTIDYLGGVYALQKQLGLSVHPAGKTALGLQGRSHFLEMYAQVVYLFGNEKETLPTWFKKQDWKHELQYHASSFLPEGLGLVQKEVKNFTIHISGAPRALMECLYLAPKNQDLMECYKLMEGLNNLQPKLVQQLLKGCSSVKVKRLFLFMAEKAQHQWFNYLDVQKIDVGKGNRSLVERGVFISKYKITLPKELATYESV